MKSLQSTRRSSACKKPTHARPNSSNCAGHYDQALCVLQEAEKADWYGYSTVINWLLRALVHQRLGQADDAHMWMDKASWE
jgi:hypothetical protein